MSNRFNGAKSRVSWGYEHLDRFERVADDFTRSHEGGIVDYGDDETGRGRARLIHLLPKSLALIVSDAIQNFRVALDYVAYELGLLSEMTWKQRKQISFPVAANRDDFFSGPAAHILGERERAFVERQQPYYTPPVKTHVLSVLAYLSNTDKHRRIQFAPQIILGNTSFKREGSRFKISSQYRAINMRRDTAFDAPITGSPRFSSAAPEFGGGYIKMQVDTNPRIHIAFHQRTGYVGGSEVIQVLRRIGMAC